MSLVKTQDEIVEQIGYDSERDLDNPTGSVFSCPWSRICGAMV